MNKETTRAQLSRKLFKVKTHSKAKFQLLFKVLISAISKLELDLDRLDF